MLTALYVALVVASEANASHTFVMTSPKSASKQASLVALGVFFMQRLNLCWSEKTIKVLEITLRNSQHCN